MKIFDCYGFKHLIERYEKLFRNRDELRKEKEFHIKNLQIAIDAADEILDINASEINDWAIAFHDVYGIEPRNIFEKIKKFFLGRYVEWRYEFAIEESYFIEHQKEILETFQNRIILI